MVGLLDSSSRDEYLAGRAAEREAYSAKRAAEREAYSAKRAEMRRTGERDFTGADAARFIAEMTPIVGDAMAAKELWEEATSENPNWGLVGLLGGATVLGLIPGIGPAAAKAVKAGARGLLDTAKRVEVDPNTMGSLLGNVRLKPNRDPVTPTPSPAQEVSGSLASGRADEVTDEMLGKLTPNDEMELFELYQSGATGMDLPMDEASRLARADEMFPRKGFHGTNADINSFQGNVFSTDNPTLASTYAKGSADAQIYPLRLGSKLGDTVVEGGGANWSQLNISDVKDPAVADWLDWAEGQKISTGSIEQAASREGRSGVQFKDINDTGPGFNSSQFKNLGYTKEQERALQKQYMEDLSKPSNVDVRLSPNLVRSEFARFDPRLSNLKNLSAAIASIPGGLLALQEMQKRANEEQYKQGLLQ